MHAVPTTLEEWKARARTFEGIHDRSPDGMMMFRAVRDTGAIVDFEWLYCNPSASRIVGRAPDELTGKRLLVEMPGNKDAGLFDIYASVVETGSPHTHEFGYRYEGLDHWFRATSIKLDDGFYVVFSDLTARKRAEDQLALLAGIVESSEHAIFRTSDTGVIETWSKGAERLYGYTSAEIVGRPIGYLVPEELRASQAEAIAELLARTGVESFQATRVTKSGATIHVAVMVSRITDSEGGTTGVAIIDRDISTEIELRARLAAADRMAWVGSFSSGAAHEINNPLTSVVGNLECALEDIRDLAGGSPSGRLLDLEAMLLSARTSADRIRTIVRGLMTFSRSDQEHRVVLELQPVVELAIKLASVKSARVRLELGATPTVRADAGRLGQALVILISNAAHAMGDDHPEQNEIRISTSTDEGGNAVILVRDTGPGISEAIIGRIFDPFFTTKPVGVGTGLGLSICRNIVAGSGGTVTATSNGDGASFRVVLPPAHADTPKPTRRRGNILAVDDEAAIGAILVRILRDHDVMTVTNARQALELLEKGSRFDVIFSDMMMAEMSGIEFFDELERRYPEAAKRTVFMTGAISPSATAFFDRIPNQHVEKPFEPASLRALVRRLVT